MLVKIINLYNFPNFEELYKHFDKVAMGYDEKEIADAKDMEEYYSKKEQKKIWSTWNRNEKNTSCKKKITSYTK